LDKTTLQEVLPATTWQGKFQSGDILDYGVKSVKPAPSNHIVAEQNCKLSDAIISTEYHHEKDSTARINHGCSFLAGGSTSG
jgi:hypothetical protein